MYVHGVATCNETAAWLDFMQKCVSILLFSMVVGRSPSASETVALCEINLLVISVWAKCSRMDEWMDKWWGGLAGS